MTTTRKTTAARTRAAAQVAPAEAPLKAPARTRAAKGTVANKAPAEVVKAPAVKTAKVRLSTGTYDVPVRGLDNQRVTEATADYLKFCEATLGVSFSGIDARALAYVATRKNDFQRLVREDSPRKRGA